ncbi:MAG: hypothetical protein KKA65_05955 [Nanoarchaeota archaeon]|nr:hypothetical protein [Nanoarchaeota archaeon]
MEIHPHAQLVLQYWFIGNRRDPPPYLAVQGNAKLISHYTWQFITANPREPQYFSLQQTFPAAQVPKPQVSAPQPSPFGAQ